MPRILIAVLSLFAAACNVPNDSMSAYPELKLAMRELEVEQHRFADSVRVPQKFEFPGHGQVTVRQLELEGYPGNTYVKCRWHYQNNTGRPVSRAFVALDVLDANGHVVCSQRCVCIFPSTRPIAEGTFYSDELRTSTRGVHVQSGWGWRITCTAEYLDEESLEADRKADAESEARRKAAELPPMIHRNIPD
jgi:hypothetical protein